MSKNSKGSQGGFSRREDGYLSILVAVVLVIVTVLAISIAALYMGSMRGAVDRLESAEALGIAEAGLERGHFALDPSQGYSCAGVNFANQSFGLGEFTVTGVATNVTTSLTASITDSTAILPVASITGFASEGGVVVTGEAIDYSGTSTSAATCGTAPCLTGALRGAAGTVAAAHASGETVSHDQCTLQSQGGVPNLTSPRVKRVVQQGSYQLQNVQAAWIVGKKVGGDETIAKWDGTLWTQEGPSAAVPDVTYNGIFMYSSADGWAVGESGSIIRYDGSSWSLFQDTGNQTFNDIFCNSSTDCWAVGNRNVFFRFNGSSWSLFDDLGSTALNAVWCTSSSNCWAVANSERFYFFNGSAWSLFDDLGSRAINDVTCLTSNDCWAVGNSYKIYHFDGANWSELYDLGNDNMEGIDCVSSTDCWAVGQGATFARWNGTSWSDYATGLPNNNFDAVSCYATDDCWAVGQNGTISRWDGASWSPVTHTLPTADFNDISTIGSGGGAGGRAKSAWKADFH